MNRRSFIGSIAAFLAVPKLAFSKRVPFMHGYEEARDIYASARKELDKRLIGTQSLCVHCGAPLLYIHAPITQGYNCSKCGSVNMFHDSRIPWMATSPMRSDLPLSRRKPTMTALCAWTERAFRYGPKQKILIESHVVKTACEALTEHLQGYGSGPSGPDSIFGVAVKRYILAHGELIIPDTRSLGEALDILEGKFELGTIIHEGMWAKELFDLRESKEETV